MRLLSRRNTSTFRAEGWVNPRPIGADLHMDRPTLSVSPLAGSYLARVLTAQVYEAAVETPLTFAASASAKLGNTVFLKREDMQPVFSFKIRGAFNKMCSLTPEQRDKGVVTCSAGNHAQGVALSASKLGINATIVMPLATPAIKVNAVRRLGGPTVMVNLHGQNFDAAAAEARRLQHDKSFTMIHPFDDPHVIAGQGTIGMEILKLFNGKPLDVIFACVGGGGLLAGLSALVKALRPEVRIIGVEADDAAGMTESLRAGKVITLPHVGLFADGAAVRTVGTETFTLCNELVDEMITVSTDEICSAIKIGFNDTRCVLEPAGALAVAGMVKYTRATGIKGKTFVAVCSGANMDFDRLRFVSERADSSETLVSVAIPEKPGAFRELYSVIYPRNVTEFSYRCNGTSRANVFVSYQSVSGRSLDEDKPILANALTARGYEVTDLSDNEMAKAHARHLAGGRRGGVVMSNDAHELLYRFEFPEAPGALDRFLHTLNHCNQGWSISLFHYRNHGHDFGRVLVGLVVENKDRTAFSLFLENLGYQYTDETDNISYLQFLK